MRRLRRAGIAVTRGVGSAVDQRAAADSEPTGRKPTDDDVPPTDDDVPPTDVAAPPTDENESQTSSCDEAAQPSENHGQLIVDATCAPADIRYPTDVSLLNEAREKTEELIDELQMYETKTHRIVSLSQPQILQAAD